MVTLSLIIIKRKQFDKFWNLHSQSNIMIDTCDNNTSLLLLKNLFEQMFEYNPLKEFQYHQFLNTNMYN